MKINFSVNSILMIFLSVILFSCNTEEETTGVTEGKSSVTFRERLVTSEKIRTEDMIVFRTKLHEAIKESQAGNKQKYEEILIEAASEYLNFNNVAHEKTESSSSIFGKALALYTDKMNELNSPKN
jgi:hypothetical protein